MNTFPSKIPPSQKHPVIRSKNHPIKLKIPPIKLPTTVIMAPKHPPIIANNTPKAPPIIPKPIGMRMMHKMIRRMTFSEFVVMRK